MNTQYAISLLKLPDQFSLEDLKRNYRKLIFENHPDRFQHLPKEKLKFLNDKIVELGDAYNLLLNIDKTETITTMNFDFENNFSSFVYQDYSFDIEHGRRKQMSKLENICYELKENGKYGLCIRLYEIGINKCLTDEYRKTGYLYWFGIYLGFLLFSLGLFNDGIKFFKLDEANYYLGNAYFFNEDYSSAIKHWNYEFTNPKTCIDDEGLYLKIVRAYFLLNEYRKCVEIVEQLNITAVAEKHYAKYTPQVLLYSIYMIEGNTFLKENIIKNKYPVTYKYIIKVLGLYEPAITEIEKIVTNEKAYNKFIKRVKPKDHKIKSEINLDYNINELKNIYQDVFSEPYPESLLIKM